MSTTAIAGANSLPIPARNLLTTDYGVSSANAAVSIALGAPGSGLCHAITSIVFSYSGSASLPSAAAPGKLTITDGSNTYCEVDVTAAGVGFLNFAPGAIRLPAATTITVTLAAGGASVVGKLTVVHGTEPAAN